MHTEHEEMAQARGGNTLHASRNATDILFEAISAIDEVIHAVRWQGLNSTNPEKLCLGLHVLYLGIELPCYLLRR
jgi:hypothetical protein